MNHRQFLCCVLLALSACSTADHTLADAQPNGATGITVLDSVQLAEADSAFVATASGLALARDGSFFVSDHANKRVYHFARTGALRNSLAREGNGPGELASFGAVTLVGDTLVVVNNSARLRIEAFDTRTGAYQWGRALASRTFRLSSAHDTVYTSTVDPVAGASIVGYVVGSDSMYRAGVVPALLAQYPFLAGPFGAVAHDVRNGHTVQAFEVSNHIFITGAQAGADSIDLPRLRRRGAALKKLRATAQDTSKGRDALYRSSVPVLAKLLSDSVAAVIHADFDLSGSLFTAQYFVSLVDFRAGKVCTDIPLPVPRDPLPQFAMLGDTLAAIVQHASDITTPGTYLLRMHVDTSACPWNHVGAR